VGSWCFVGFEVDRKSTGEDTCEIIKRGHLWDLYKPDTCGFKGTADSFLSSGRLLSGFLMGVKQVVNQPDFLLCKFQFVVNLMIMLILVIIMVAFFFQKAENLLNLSKSVLFAMHRKVCLWLSNTS
jgi:hypothetical protein